MPTEGRCLAGEQVLLLCAPGLRRNAMGGNRVLKEIIKSIYVLTLHHEGALPPQLMFSKTEDNESAIYDLGYKNNPYPHIGVLMRTPSLFIYQVGYTQPHRIPSRPYQPTTVFPIAASKSGESTSNLHKQQHSRTGHSLLGVRIRVRVRVKVRVGVSLLTQIKTNWV